MKAHFPLSVCTQLITIPITKECPTSVADIKPRRYILDDLLLQFMAHFAKSLLI